MLALREGKNWGAVEPDCTGITALRRNGHGPLIVEADVTP
jgi:hypothetical protein